MSRQAMPLSSSHVSDCSYTRPLLVQKGRTVGCFVIFLLVVVGAITIGVGLGFGVGFGTKKVTEDTLPHKITVRHLMNHLKVGFGFYPSSPTTALL